MWHVLISDAILEPTNGTHLRDTFDCIGDLEIPFSGNYLMTIDKGFPLTKEVSDLLPENETVRARVLHDRAAGRLCMRLVDSSISSAVLEKHGKKNLAFHQSIFMDGRIVQLRSIRGQRLRLWLASRSIAVPNSSTFDRMKGLAEKYLKDITSRKQVMQSKSELLQIIDKHKHA
jgi:hypothetical protein